MKINIEDDMADKLDMVHNVQNSRLITEDIHSEGEMNSRDPYGNMKLLLATPVKRIVWMSLRDHFSNTAIQYISVVCYTVTWKVDDSNQEERRRSFGFEK